ncbi:MAG TPA: PH domain-containing protein [Acidimicrobiales bacterium]|nr:PH domain-containing protein [Acidimicrobiales bacterium]
MRPDLTSEQGWQRLHPLTPLARVGRLVPVVVVGFVLSSTHANGQGGAEEDYYVAAIAVLTVILGVVHWLVTRWKLDGDVLRIETGLIRRDSRQLPLARIQAVDIVRPLLGRLLGLSELRIRLASSGSTDGRLAYLSEAAALELRQFLLAGHREPTAATQDHEAEVPMAQVPTGRLVGSVLLSVVSIVLIAAVVTLLILANVAPAAAAAVASVLAVYLFSIAAALWRRLSGEFHFEAVEAPEGVRIRRGLLQTVSETVPYGRIQAVRQIEPLLWRPLGWCRLEVDIAGSSGKSQRGEGSGVSRKALLPVGSHQDAWHMVNRLMGGPTPVMTKPPHRSRFKAPMSYHYLAAGHDTGHAVCVTGRLRRVTSWVPLEKAQSIRRVQGPAQRRLRLASVHVDVAGRRVRAEFRDRSVEEADALVRGLTELSRQARLAREGPSGPPADPRAAVAPAGWYPDPSAQHELRYWDEERWTEHVSTGGVSALDPP